MNLIVNNNRERKMVGLIGFPISDFGMRILIKGQRFGSAQGSASTSLSTRDLKRLGFYYFAYNCFILPENSDKIYSFGKILYIKLSFSIGNFPA